MLLKCCKSCLDIVLTIRGGAGLRIGTTILNPADTYGVLGHTPSVDNDSPPSLDVVLEMAPRRAMPPIYLLAHHYTDMIKSGRPGSCWIIFVIRS